MKRFFVSLCFLVFLADFSFAQGVPNGDFEKWVKSGSFWNQTYTPEDWYGLKVSAGILDYDLSVPSRIADAQNGSYAATITSKKLSPLLRTIISGLVSTLDTTGMLDSIVDFQKPFPGFLCNANFDILKAFNQSSSLTSLFTSDLNDLDTGMLNALVRMDVHEIIKGGMRVDSIPKSLYGYYKYVPGDTSVTDSIDAGMVIMLGICGEEQGDARHVVGIGARLLYETDKYIPFKTEYIQFSENSPDTVVLMFLSSFMNAAENSTLTLDNLTLNYCTTDSVRNLHLDSLGTEEAFLVWEKTANAFDYQVAWSSVGDSLNALEKRVSSSNACHLKQLQPETEYQFYVRARFGLNVYGPWSNCTFTTLERPCDTVVGFRLSEDTLFWQADDSSFRYQLQYALASDTTQWADTLLKADSLVEGQMLFRLPDLLPDTAYIARLRAWCREERQSDWVWRLFRTAPVVVEDGIPSFGTAFELLLYPNPSRDGFYLQLPAGKYRMQLCNSLGQHLLQMEQLEGTVWCPVGRPGLYLLRVSDAAGKSVNKVVTVLP